MTRHARGPLKARKAKAKKPIASSVYTAPLPPRTWATDHRQAQGLLAHSLEAEQAIMSALGFWPARDLPSWIEESGFSYVAWWHSALAERDAARIAALEGTVSANNADIAATAHVLGLAVEVAPIAPVSPAFSGPDRLLSLDGAEMARRIEAAAAQYKNRQKNGRQGTIGRNLKYLCPSCMRPIRAAGDNRLLICAGTVHAPHDPIPMAFDEGSQPAYRLEDDANGEQHTQSAIQRRAAIAKGRTAAHQKAQADGLDDMGLKTLTPHSDIPF